MLRLTFSCVITIINTITITTTITITITITNIITIIVIISSSSSVGEMGPSLSAGQSNIIFSCWVQCIIRGRCFDLVQPSNQQTALLSCYKGPECRSTIPSCMMKATLRVQVPKNHLGYSLNSLKGVIQRIMKGSIIGVIKGDTWSFYYNSYTCPAPVLKSLLSTTQVPNNWVLGPSRQLSSNTARML